MDDKHTGNNPVGKSSAVTVDNDDLPRSTTSTDHVTEATANKSGMLFLVEDRPPVSVIILYAFQITLAVITGGIAEAFVIHGMICGGDDLVFLSHLISTTLCMAGIATFIQVTIGIRIPISQCSAAQFLPAIFALMQTDLWKCPETTIDGTLNGTALLNDSISGGDSELWRPRLLEISGALALASILHVVIGLTGVLGFLLKFIGPLTVTPSIALISLTLYDPINFNARHQYGVTIFVVAAAVLFAIVLRKIQIPVPSWNKEKGCHRKGLPLFRIFASLLAITVGWLLCLILTLANVFTNDPHAIGYRARTDSKLSAVTDTDWFSFPYPGQYGMPTFSVVSSVAFIPAILGSVIESIGVYYATAHVIGLPPPPRHAFNRGIMVEGIASIVSGVYGACHATTSYSSVIGIISYSGMASRITWQVSALIFLLGAIFGKFGALLAAIPDPIVAGILILNFGMLFSVAIANLKGVSLHLPRNQMVLGLAMVVGVCLPQYVTTETINTGNVEADQIIQVLLGNAPTVGAAVGFILDNILPGTREERGMIDFVDSDRDKLEGGDLVAPYDLPFHKRGQHVKVLRYIPFMSCYNPAVYDCCRDNDNSRDLGKHQPSTDTLQTSVDSINMRTYC